MKESIAVFCRIKPVESRREGNYEVSSWEQDPGKAKLEVQIPRLDQDGVVNNKQELHRFKFSKVFEKNAYQDQVFQSVAKGVIDNCLEGYNGTIFAYGQTGSGKTFTVTGGPEKYADRGLIPRTLNYLFQQYLSTSDVVYKTQVSYLELYNEAGYDLLDPLHDIKQMDDLQKVTILEDGSGGIKIRNLSTVPIATEEEGINQLFIGDTNRAIAETPMNQASTRSHCIFTVHLEIMVPGESTVKRSKLHLVDLAGSERIGKSGVTGQIATEGKYINLSLHYLEQVIVALSEKKRDHIPYRNSILTSVLRDSLGGNAATTMIATISLEKRNLQESLATCRFAQRVAQIKNSPVLNEELDPTLQIARLKREVLLLKEQLQVQNIPSEDLTQDDKNDLENRLSQFLKDPDPESDLNLDGDLRKINFIFKKMKKIINLGGSIDNTVINGSDQIVAGQIGNRQSKQFQITPEEIIRLKDILEQRDAEIAVLTQLLKKEKQKPKSLPASYNPSKYTGNISDQLRSVNEGQENRTGSRMEDYSLGKKEAFEEFRRNHYANNTSYQNHKDQLTALIKDAKQEGSKVQSFRSEMNKLKGELEHVTRQIAANNAAGFGTIELTTKEAQIRADLEAERGKYNKSVGILKILKPKVDHLQHSLEKQRIELHKQFNIWFKTEAAQAFGRSRPTSSVSRASSNTESAVLYHSPPGSANIKPVTMTGDPKTDSDISEFIRARQRVIQNRQK